MAKYLTRLIIDGHQRSTRRRVDDGIRVVKDPAPDGLLWKPVGS